MSSAVLSATGPGIEAALPEIPEGVVSFVRERRGTDLGCYRASTVARRIHARMRRVGAHDADAYLSLLETDADEVDELLRYIRIPVTRFFRNAPAFHALAAALPDVAERHPDEPLRIWSAGCSSGEEAYSLLMLAHDALGARAAHLEVTASDVEAALLAQAHPDRARYHVDVVQELPEALRARYLELRGEKCDRYHPGTALRDVAHQISWLQHDLLSGTPPRAERFHVVACRNVLIYFAPPAQRAAQALLARCLVPGGYLLLGEAEALVPDLAPHFEIVDAGSRLFRLREMRGRSESLA